MIEATEVVHKLLLFGGTFDPPHYGHISILKNALALVQPDKAIVMPAGVPPHKQASTTSAELRLQMCRCFCGLSGVVQLSDMEIQRQGKSYTWQTVQTLQQKYPAAQVYLCIGSDMLLTFVEWKNYEWLLKQVVLVVQNRQLKDIPMTQQMANELIAKGGRVLFAAGEVEEVSSTWLRQQLAKSDKIDTLVPPPADKIIKQYGLYHVQKEPTE